MPEQIIISKIRQPVKLRREYRRPDFKLECEIMKKGTLYCVLSAVILLLCAAAATAGDAKSFSSPDELDGHTFGMLVGVPDWDLLVKKRFKKSEVVYYNTYADLILALKTGKIDTFIIDEPVVRSMMAEEPGLTYLPEILKRDNYAFIFSKERTGLASEFNNILTRLIKDGTVEKLKKSGSQRTTRQRKPSHIQKQEERGQCFS